MLNSFKTVFSSTPLSGDSLVPRWTEDELASRKLAFEALPAELWNVEDHYGVVEYLIQLYYPQTTPLLQHEWDSAMARMRQAIDENLRLSAAGKLQRSAAASLNQRMEEYRKLLYRSYDMPLADFERLVVPALLRFPFAVGLTLTAAETKLLWKASAPYPERSEHAARYARERARDSLVGRLADCVLEAASHLRKTYETLRQAQNAGCREALLIAPKKCSCIHDFLENRMISIAEVLQSFERCTPSLPPPVTACTLSETPRLCSLSILPQEPDFLEPGDDADFAEWLQQSLRPARSPLAPDWELLIRQQAQ